MKRGSKLKVATIVLTLTVGVTLALAASGHLALFIPFADPGGVVRTSSSAGEPAGNNAFFQSLGTNGRSCASCHQPSDAWTVTPSHVRQRFEATEGLDPIFRTNDGANCPSADVHTLQARRDAYSMLLSKGLIRVSRGVPANAEFSVAAIDDPHNCPETTPAGLALFRRPLPSTNLRFLTTVMWDGRESFPGQTLQFDLTDQAAGATLGHAQAAQRPTDAQLAEIVNFELQLSTAQAFDDAAGELDQKSTRL